VESPDVTRAIDAAISIAVALDLQADDATVLQNSNKLALRLLPCDVFARVAPAGHEHAPFEVDLAQRLAKTESPVAALEPRVEPRGYERDGFEVTLWTYYEPANSEISAAAYADALQRLHAGMRKLDVPTPHLTDRVASAEQIVTSRDLAPQLDKTDREMLASTLRRLRNVIWERGLPSSCFTASRTQATCSAPRTDRSSWTSRHAVAGRSSSIAPMSLRRSASTTRASIKRCFATVGNSFSQWSRHGVMSRAINFRMECPSVGNF
jgi:hypothetical protein